MKPLISVCIPAYNRTEFLGPLLDSIVAQDYHDYEIVICEDGSPKRAEIKVIVDQYMKRFPNLSFRYFENPKNYGYDKNLRELLIRSQGEYCLFMGNDDLLAPHALQVISSGVKRHKDIGVVMRSYASFDGTTDNIVQTYRYFDQERFFPASVETSTTFFRRCVVIPGLTLHRESALKHTTEQFDGTLLYQLHLVLRILLEKNGLFLPEIVTLYRTGGTPDFGNSESEKGKFTPTEQTPESSLHFVEGMIRIARVGEKETGAPCFKPIFRDIANYSYPILSIQSKRSLGTFLNYGFTLARMGFWKNHYFWAYFLSLLILGESRMNALIVFIKKRLGYTPTLGGVSKGQVS
ncbi:MAG: glycosyltransferase family 2 protein [Xanthomonadaceae bacterium]|nr:glycosyltransferase family 2 protein [Xanthomonadaceae bacterium]